MKKFFLPLFLIPALCFAFTSVTFSQTKKRKAKTTKTIQAKSTAPVEATQADSPANVSKKNSRPDETGNAESERATESETQLKKNARAGDSKPNKSAEVSYKYFYQFSQPEFLVRKMIIEHNDDGKGTIIFEKKDVDEPITEPIQISASTLEKLRNYFQSLNFLDSKENYQSERHYAHLGVMKIRVKEGEKSREVEFDWSENKDAKGLVDEYRKIGDQFIWIFDVKLARDLQPLETPRMIERLETMVRDNWMSDPLQLVPFLRELSNDERIPLIGRNRAAKIAKEIDKNSQRK